MRGHTWLAMVRSAQVVFSVFCLSIHTGRLLLSQFNFPPRTSCIPERPLHLSLSLGVFAVVGSVEFRGWEYSFLRAFILERNRFR